MSRRKIIKIDEDKCTGCGLCIPNCAKGVIKIIGGKARLIDENLCDGLGKCLGHCPQGAITIEEVEAGGNRETKVAANKRHHHAAGACPGSKAVSFAEERALSNHAGRLTKTQSQLRQWPVQINLVPPNAPYFKDADILIAADCVPFAYSDFHEELLKGKILLVGCPKLDDMDIYKEKIGQIIKDNDIKSVTYAHMEVPCCFGFIDVIKNAIAVSGRPIAYQEAVISIRGERLK